MNKLVFFALIAFAFLWACQQTDKAPQKSLNPNGDSELALLMRTMYEETMEMKKALKEGEKYDHSFETEAIFTATPTEEGKNASTTYKAFAQNYQHVMEQYAEASGKDLKGSYEQIVGNCQSCHQAICPGPLRRIKHLEL
ncbi:MAG TPA: hypothetical protein VJ917_06925 [Saprospiraceae bacterium]|nr:hypothetical protein [Saprospiraceae bacterium]